MRRIAQSIIAGGLVAAVGIVPSAGAKNDALRNKFPNQITDTRPCDGGTITYVGVSKMWPPNHKYTVNTVTAQADNSDDTVTLQTTGTHDQMDGDTEVNGTGHTADDIVLSDEKSNTQSGTSNVVLASTDDDGNVIHTVKLRSERAGSLKDGRTYSLAETATFGDGEPCTIDPPYRVSVPHDMRDKG